jgi:hypothetical protein
VQYLVRRSISISLMAGALGAVTVLRKPVPTDEALAILEAERRGETETEGELASTLKAKEVAHRAERPLLAVYSRRVLGFRRG